MTSLATHATTCPLDCPDSCALQVITDGEGVVEIGPGADHPLTDGFICSKVRRFHRRLDHPTRLTQPLRRTGPKGEGRFAPITWDEAVAEITERFRAIADEWGGEAILPFHYGGSNGALTEGFLDDLYFARLGASQLAKTVCAAPTTAVAVGMYGKMPGVAYADYPEAQCIIVWGTNPKATSIHLIPQLREAKRRGAFIAVVDPMRNFSDAEVDLHLAVQPGGDLALALGMIRYWQETDRLNHAFLAQHARGEAPLLEAAADWPLDRAAAVSGVAADDIARLASVYADASPAVIRCGWGLERNRNGGQAVAAVLAMPTLLGKFGVRGGGYTMSNSGAVRSRVGERIGVEWNTRTINMSRLGPVLHEPLDPPIKGLFVYNCNPVATMPEQNAVIAGLRRDDLFTVVSEQVHTDTVDYADIVLPATTFLEHTDLRVAYGAYVVGGIQPVIPPQGEARSNAEVFAAMGRAMGFEDPAFGWTPAEQVVRVAEALEGEAGPLDAGQLAAGRVAPTLSDNPIQLQTVHPRTPDGRIDLTPTELGPAPYAYVAPPDESFPLTLITPASSRMISSTLGEFNFAELTVAIHPEDAATRGIGDRDEVRVHNTLGEVRCRARVTPRVRSGVVSMAKGAWRKSSANGATSNALCPSHVNVVAGGACFNDARVEVAPVRSD